MIEITAVKVISISIDSVDGGVPKITGSYNLVTSKGTVLATQQFNGYNGPKFEFDSAFLKDIIDTVEQKIEIDTGVQQAVKMIKGANR